MEYDFNSIIERKNTDSIKYDFAPHNGKPADILPLWVADMDFKAPDCVIAALEEKSRHGIFGYSESREDYFNAVHNWFYSNFNWNTQAEWLVKTPGVVHAVCTAIRSLTKKGDAVLIQQPVYYPFADAILRNHRRLTVNQLVYDGNAYRIDFADFENQIVQSNVKLFILCSPHNPVGRVWSKEELTQMGEICLKHHVLVIADEIHADFVYPGYRHTVFASLSSDFAENAITCTAPTKTFNLAGLQVSNIFIQNRQVRKLFSEEMSQSGHSQINVMGITACRAAYAGGREWLGALQDYLSQNLRFTREFLRQRLPGIRLVEPEGTYLIWLDCSGLGLSDKQLDDLIVDRARLWLDAGPMFGAGGNGFQRVNIACPQALLQEAYNRLETAIASL